MNRWLPIVAGVIVGLGIGVVIFAILVNPKSPQASDQILDTESAFGASVDMPAPDFELFDLSGQKTSIQDQQGQVVLLNFWATWCGPCRVEMPEFQDRFEQYDDQLSVLAVNFDEDEEAVASFVNELGLTFNILLDPGAKVQELYQVQFYPTSFIIDKEGIIRYQHVGILTASQLDGYLSEVGLK